MAESEAGRSGGGGADRRRKGLSPAELARLAMENPPTRAPGEAGPLGPQSSGLDALQTLKDVAEKGQTLDAALEQVDHLTCWYCGKAPGVPEASIAYKMARTLVAGPMGETSIWRPLVIARCPECKRIHRRADWRGQVYPIPILLGVCLLLGGATLCMAAFSEGERLPFSRGFMLSIAAVTVLAGVGFVALGVRLRPRRLGIRGKTDVRYHPAMRAFREAGYGPRETLSPEELLQELGEGTSFTAGSLARGLSIFGQTGGEDGESPAQP